MKVKNTDTVTDRQRERERERRERERKKERERERERERDDTMNTISPSATGRAYCIFFAAAYREPSPTHIP